MRASVVCLWILLIVLWDWIITRCFKVEKYAKTERTWTSGRQRRASS
jgi:hypothetical protein